MRTDVDDVDPDDADGEERAGDALRGEQVPRRAQRRRQLQRAHRHRHSLRTGVPERANAIGQRGTRRVHERSGSIANDA